MDISQDNRIKETQTQILQYLNQNEDISEQPLTVLGVQEEQIDRVANITEIVHQELNISQKLIKQMTSIRAWWHALFGTNEPAEAPTEIVYNVNIAEPQTTPHDNRNFLDKIIS